MSSTLEKLQIKKLNDRLLTQNVVMQTLIEILIDSGIITEKELDLRLEQNIEDTQNILDSIETKPNEMEEFSGIYYGVHGEA